MKRREFIAAMGGAAAWPVVARGQQTDRVRRVGVLLGLTATDPEGKARIGAFLQALQQIGLDRWPQYPNHSSLYRR
jgi:putative ABC transport system substrate-binding protein